MNRLRLAFLDLYNGIPNEGMRCLRQIVEGFSEEIEYDVFDVRMDGDLPDLGYDIYISSGGPGDPTNMENEGGWQQKWIAWLTSVYAYNRTAEQPKYVFLICHSFQMAVHHFGLATVVPRRGISFGTFPVHVTEFGKGDVLFTDLEEPFYAADFRRFQVVAPREDRLLDMGARVICLEKDRPHVQLERAVMAVRWHAAMVGVQFHPEADAEGLQLHFSQPEIKLEVIADHGREKWVQIMKDLADPERISRTHDHILPNFLRGAIAALRPDLVEA